MRLQSQTPLRKSKRKRNALSASAAEAMRQGIHVPIGTKAMIEKNCHECGTAMRQGKATLHFERGGFYADVENVNAMLCRRCGKRSIPGPTALKISEAVERLFRVGKDLDMTGISFHKLAS